MIQEQKEWLHLPQSTINERLKFLISFYNISARTLSRELGVADTNTQNYIGPRQADPGAAYLEKLLFRFNQVDAYWLLTGDGEPFTEVPRTADDEHAEPSDSEIYRFHKNGTPIPAGAAHEPNPAYRTAKKISRSMIVGNVAGNATQNYGSDSAKDVLIEQMRAQLADKDKIIRLLEAHQPKP